MPAFSGIKSSTGTFPVATKIADNATKWPHPDNGRSVIEGIEYSQHALGRMMPNGMQWVDGAGKVIEGRGVPPSVVQNAIQFGTQSPGKFDSIIHTYENVRVYTDVVTDAVRTIIKLGN